MVVIFFHPLFFKGAWNPRENKTNLKLKQPTLEPWLLESRIFSDFWGKPCWPLVGGFSPPTHVKNMRQSNGDHFPNFRDENKKCLKPPASEVETSLGKKMGF